MSYKAIRTPLRKKIAEEYQAGAPTSVLAERYAIERRTIYRIIREYNAFRVKKFTLEDLENLARSGMTRPQIASVTGYSELYLYRILRGIKK